MTTTAPNTRVSDLNKIIRNVEVWQSLNPDMELNGKDPETDLMQIVTLGWIREFGTENVQRLYLWASAGCVLNALYEFAEHIGLEDTSIFDRFLGNLPLMVSSIVGMNIDRDFDEEGLAKYGDTLVSDFFESEPLTPEEAWAEGTGSN